MSLKINISLGKKAGFKEWILILFTGSILVLTLIAVYEEEIVANVDNLQTLEGKLVDVVKKDKLSAKVVLDNHKEILYSNIIDTFPFNWFRDHEIFKLKKNSLIEAQVFVKKKNQLTVEGRSLKVNGEMFYSLTDYQNDLNESNYYKFAILTILPIFWLISMLVFAFDLKIDLNHRTLV